MRLKNIEKILSISILNVLILLIALVSTTWATLSFVKPQDASQEVSYAKTSEIPQDLSQESRSRAPEPATLALFGSGIFGAIISFMRSAYAAVKRIIDIIGSVVAMVILSPICLVVALLIKLTSKGPVLFTQTRVGKDGQLFEIYKFRTMKTDAEKETGPVWATQNDNRLIPIGKLLRKTHIDEVPQFLNVLKGDMSIIGPRPERPFFVEQLKKQICDYERRLAIKPGITGLAQVRHNYDRTIHDVKKKIKYDILYIKKMCLWTDIRILLRTARVVLTGEGSH